MFYPVDLSLLRNTNHMPALPVLERSMPRTDLKLRDFCIPVNPYFPTPDMLTDLQQRLGHILRYYPGDNRSVAKSLGRFLEIDPATIVMANGSTELITWINERLITESLVTDVPTFGRWTDNPRDLGRQVHLITRKAERNFELTIDELISFVHRCEAKSLAICNPNNPSGAIFTRTELRRLLNELKHLDVIVIDESFIDFADEHDIPSMAHEVANFENAIVLKSLGKNLGLHGLRCGYAVASAKLATSLRHMLPPWNVNSLAEEFIRLLSTSVEQYEAGRRQVVRDSQAFAERLARFEEFTVYPTHANFVYCRLNSAFSGEALRDHLLQHTGCFVRECGSKIGSSSQFFRIATRPPEQQQELIEAMETTLEFLRETIQPTVDPNIRKSESVRPWVSSETL